MDTFRENTQNNLLSVCEIRENQLSAEISVYIFHIARPVGLELSIRNLHITLLNNSVFFFNVCTEDPKYGRQLIRYHVCIVKFCGILILTFRHRASCILGQAFHYFPENAFYIFNQQIYFII